MIVAGIMPRDWVGKVGNDRNTLRPLNNLASLFDMRFLTHLRARSLKIARTRPNGLKQHAICPPGRAIRFARVGTPKTS